jgi:hypothetical protein
MSAIAESLLSVNAAAEWLKEHGVEPCSRHGVYVLIAQQKLPLAASASRALLVRETDLERFAAEHEKAATRR